MSMKHCLFVTLALMVPSAKAQDRVADEEARNIAKILVEAAGKVQAPFKMEVDAAKPFAVRRDDKGALLLPAKGLNADALEKAGSEIVPLGQVWMRNIAPVADNKLVSRKQLQNITIKPKDEEITVAMSWAGVRKEKDKLVLVLFGSEKKPYLTLPLEKADGKQELPLEFTVSIEDEKALITVQIVGKYKTVMRVGPQTE
jgi:hypothetical protein